MKVRDFILKFNNGVMPKLKGERIINSLLNLTVNDTETSEIDGLSGVKIKTEEGLTIYYYIVRYKGVWYHHLRKNVFI